MITKKQKNWQELISDMQRVDAMSCKPAFARFPNNFITDENKSVKWNREQVVKNHNTYDKEVARLNTEKNKERDKVMQDVYLKIQQELPGLTQKKAKVLFEKIQRITKDHCPNDTSFENVISELKSQCTYLQEVIPLFENDKEATEEMERE